MAQEGRDLPKHTVDEDPTWGWSPQASLHMAKGPQMLHLPACIAASPPSPRPSALSSIPSLQLCMFPGAAITQDYKLSGLNNRMYCLTVPEADSLRSKCLWGWFFLKA